MKRVSKYLSGASLFLIVLLLTIGMFSMVRVYNSRKSIDEVARIDVPLIEFMTNIETHQLEQSINFERSVRYAEEIGKYKDAKKNFILSDSLFRALGAMVNIELIQAEERVKTGISFATSDNQRIIMKELLNALKKMEKEHLTFERDALSVIDDLKAGKINQAISQVSDVEAKEESFNKEVEFVLIQLEKYTEEIVSHIERDEQTTLRLVVLFTCFFVMSSIIISFMSGNKTQFPIDELTKGVKKLGEGDKSVQVHQTPSGLTSELTTTFNEMVVKLHDAQEEIDQHIQFSNRTSKDLNAPIADLLNTLAVINVKDSGMDTKLNHARIKAEQIEMIVNALNDVNALRESLRIKPSVLNFDTILAQLEQKLSIDSENSNVIITKWFAKCSDVKYPLEHLTQILEHIISNALKYSSENRLLEIEMESYLKDGQTVLEIRDNGIGFDSKTHGREIFEPFKQLDSNANGNGMGLYMVKTIVDFHNGRIEVKSTPEKGSIFTIYLN